MKKFFAILILTLFALSVVPVYSQDSAEESDSVEFKMKDADRNKILERNKKIKNTPAFERNKNLEKNKVLRVNEKVEGTDSFIEKLVPEDFEIFAKLGRAEQMKIIKENKPELIKKVKIMKVTDEEFKVRDISKERIKEYVMKYKEARKDAKEIRDGLKETRDAVKTAQTDEEKITAAKDYLTKMVDAEITELQSLKERIQNNQDISQEESSDSVAKIDNAITALNELKTKISNAAALKELRDIAKEIKKHAMLRHLHKTRAVAANICNGVLKRSEHIEQKAEVVLAKAEEAGSDTSTLNSQIEGLSTLLETAKTQCKDAKTAFESAKNTENQEAKKTAVKSFIEATKKAAETVKQAHTKLVEIRATAKSLKLDVDAEKVEEIAETEGGENE